MILELHKFVFRTAQHKLRTAHFVGVAENARPEIAGQENNGPNRKG